MVIDENGHLAKMTMTSFYVEVDRGGQRDKKAEAKVVGLALLFAMAQQPQASFVDALSEPPFGVEAELFYERIMLHRARHQQGNIRFHRPEDYKVHRVTIVKRSIWIQLETLIFEIHHNPPPPDLPHPPFYIRVDRSAWPFDKSRAFDRVICSPIIPVLPCTKIFWSLLVTINHNLNANTFDVVRLAALLHATRRVAPDYSISGHNCFWHTSATRRVIEEHILARWGVEDPRQGCCFRLHRCLGCRMGIPTDPEVQNIHNLYVELLEIEGIQVVQV